MIVVRFLAVAFVLAAARFSVQVDYIAFVLEPCRYLGSFVVSGAYSVAVVCYFAAL